MFHSGRLAHGQLLGCEPSIVSSAKLTYLWLSEERSDDKTGQRGTMSRITLNTQARGAARRLSRARLFEDCRDAQPAP